MSDYFDSPKCNAIFLSALLWLQYSFSHQNYFLFSSVIRCWHIEVIWRIVLSSKLLLYNNVNYYSQKNNPIQQCWRCFFYIMSRANFGGGLLFVQWHQSWVFLCYCVLAFSNFNKLLKLVWIFFPWTNIVVMEIGHYNATEGFVSSLFL